MAGQFQVGSMMVPYTQAFAPAPAVITKAKKHKIKKSHPKQHTQTLRILPPKVHDPLKGTVADTITFTKSPVNALDSATGSFNFGVSNDKLSADGEKVVAFFERQKEHYVVALEVKTRCFFKSVNGFYTFQIGRENAGNWTHEHTAANGPFHSTMFIVKAKGTEVRETIRDLIDVRKNRPVTQAGAGITLSGMDIVGKIRVTLTFYCKQVRGKSLFERGSFDHFLDARD